MLWDPSLRLPPFHSVQRAVESGALFQFNVLSSFRSKSGRWNRVYFSCIGSNPIESDLGSTSAVGPGFTSMQTHPVCNDMSHVM